MFGGQDRPLAGDGIADKLEDGHDEVPARDEGEQQEEQRDAGDEAAAGCRRVIEMLQEVASIRFHDDKVAAKQEI